MDCTVDHSPSYSKQNRNLLFPFICSLFERSYFKISTNQDFLVFCKNIAPNSSYENFEGIYMYLQIKADKSVVSDFLFDIWFRSYSLLKVKDMSNSQNLTIASLAKNTKVDMGQQKQAYFCEFDIIILEIVRFCESDISLTFRML